MWLKTIWLDQSNCWKHFWWHFVIHWSLTGGWLSLTTWDKQYFAFYRYSGEIRAHRFNLLIKTWMHTQLVYCVHQFLLTHSLSLIIKRICPTDTSYSAKFMSFFHLPLKVFLLHLIQDITVYLGHLKEGTCWLLVTLVYLDWRIHCNLT